MSTPRDIDHGEEQPADYPMSPEEQAAIDAALAAGWHCIEEGRFRPARDFLAELRAKV